MTEAVIKRLQDLTTIDTLDDATLIPVQNGAGLLSKATLAAFGAALFTGTPIAIVRGGTGADNAADARTNLGLAIGSDVQAYSANLTAFGNLTGAADRLPYFTGAGALSLATFTSYGRTLVATANAGAAQTALGLVIGTDVQAYNANLDAIAGVTSAADKLFYFTGSGTGAVADLTSVARTLLAQTTQSAMRTTGLGLGTAATANTGTSGGTVPLLNAANTWSAAQAFTTAAIDLQVGQIAFPATQNPSSNANTLDDYEEGTFTPTFTGSSTNPTSPTYAAQTYGRYTKIGKHLFFDIRIRLSGYSGVGTGNLQVAGLPLAPASDVAAYVGFAESLTGISYGADYGPPTGIINPGNTYISMQSQGVTGRNPITWSNMTTATDMIIGGHYQTSS